MHVVVRYLAVLFNEVNASCCDSFLLISVIKSKKMAKLGYTWYPKDWNNSESVFQLTLEQRGLYRELIDLAMLNDNKTEIKSAVWCRKWDVTHDYLWKMLEELKNLDLINIPNYNSKEEDIVYTLLIPSCENRLNLVRGGQKGGKKSKPTPKPKDKPTQKPTSKQTKTKRETKKEKEKKIEFFNIFWDKYPKKVSKQKCEDKWKKLKDKEIETILNTLDKFLKHKPFEEYTHPNPLTYLNAARWDDVIPEPKEDISKRVFIPTDGRY